MAEPLSLNIQFGGGAELLFDKIKKREIELPALKKYLPDCQHEKWTIRELLLWIKENLLREREELFLQGESVRPGILVLINDADWELCGELDYELQHRDTIMFISTLHVNKMAEPLSLNLQFGGGAELLFDKIKKREVELPALKKYLPDCQHEKWTIRELLLWIKENLLREREELFLQGESVRPGILVLINDADWELCGELDYELQHRDTIMFISTLHGG